MCNRSMFKPIFISRLLSDMLRSDPVVLFIDYCDEEIINISISPGAHYNVYSKAVVSTFFLGSS